MVPTYHLLAYSSTSTCRSGSRKSWTVGWWRKCLHSCCPCRLRRIRQRGVAGCRGHGEPPCPCDRRARRLAGVPWNGRLGSTPINWRHRRSHGRGSLRASRAGPLVSPLLAWTRSISVSEAERAWAAVDGGAVRGRPRSLGGACRRAARAASTKCWHDERLRVRSAARRLRRLEYGARLVNWTRSTFVSSSNKAEPSYGKTATCPKPDCGAQNQWENGYRMS